MKLPSLVWGLGLTRPFLYLLLYIGRSLNYLPVDLNTNFQTEQCIEFGLHKDVTLNLVHNITTEYLGRDSSTHVYPPNINKYNWLVRASQLELICEL